MLQSAIEQMQIKDNRRKDEERMEGEFKKKLMEKFSEDERLEQYNAQRRRQKEIELKKEVCKATIIFIKFVFRKFLDRETMARKT